MSARVRQMTAGAAPRLPQGFIRIRIKGEHLKRTGAQLAVCRTGPQGTAEYLRAFNGAAEVTSDLEEGLQYRWGADEGRVIPHAVAAEGDDRVLDLGRNVNGHMDQQSNYRLQLFLGGEPIQRECTLAWMRVAPVRPGDLATYVARPMQPPAEAPEPAPAAPAESATPARLLAPSAFEEPPAQTELQNTGGAGAIARGGRLVPLVALVGLLFLAMTGAGVWWWSMEMQTEPPTQPNVAAAGPATLPSASSTVTAPVTPPVTSKPPAPPVAPAASPPETREQRLTRAITQGRDAALDAGRQAQLTKEFDEAELLFLAACDRGQAEGCRLAGQLYDPVDLTAERTKQRSPADVRQAIVMYKRALDGGSAEVQEDLRRLRVLLDKAAQAGDRAARALLDTLPKKP